MMALRMNRNAERCVKDAVDRAARQIRHPQFAQVAAARNR